MKVTNVEKKEKSTVELTIQIDADQFEQAVQKAYLKSRGSISVPGFRKGKAPRKIIEGMYGSGVFYEEAINEVYPEAYEQAVREQGLEDMGHPKMEIVEVGKEGFTFKALVSVRPEVKLGEYKGLTAHKEEVKVTEKDIDEEMKPFIDRATRLVSVKRKAKKGDTAVIDFEGFDNGTPFEGGKGENYELKLGSGMFVPGFEEQVIGMKAGEEKDIDITFPEDYHKDLAGKTVVFHVKVNAVKVKEVPAIDDEFAKDVSEFDTLADLKKDIKAKMTADRQQAADQAFEDDLMGKVADGITCDVPDAMVEEQAKRFVENLKLQIQQQGIPYDQYLKLTNMTEEDLLGQAKEPALRQVKLELAMDAIAKAESVEVSEEEISAEYDKMAEQYGMKAEDLKKYITADSLKAQLTNQKVVKIVVDSAKATKVEEKKTAKKTDAEDAEAGEAPAADESAEGGAQA